MALETSAASSRLNIERDHSGHPSILIERYPKGDLLLALNIPYCYQEVSGKFDLRLWNESARPAGTFARVRRFDIWRSWNDEKVLFIVQISDYRYPGAPCHVQCTYCI